MATKKVQPKTDEPVRVDLLASLKEAAPTVDIGTFRANVLDLFSGIINEDSIDADTRGKLARLRARIEIELKGL